MSRSKPYHAFILFLLLIVCGKAFGQLNPDSIGHKGRGEYALVLYAGGGISFYSGDPGTPTGLDAVEVNKIFPAGTIRLMWHPDHLLRVGLESGWNTFYSYKARNGNVSGNVIVRATPFMLVFSMPVAKRINVFAGVGSYLITSKLEYEVQTRSSSLSLGWMAAASYMYPINKDFGIIAEFKWQDAYETRDANFTIQLQLRWKLLKW